MESGAVPSVECVGEGDKPEGKGDPRPVLRKLDKVLLGAVFAGMVGFLFFGSVARAPYWLFDGTSFLVTLSLSWLAFASRSGSGQRMALVLIWRLAAVSVLIDIGFLVAGVILDDEVMNPWAPEGGGAFGRDGSSFIVCSFFSALANSFVACRFKAFG